MNRSRPSYMSARRQRHLERLSEERRKLSREQAERIVRMRDNRGLTHNSIAAWFRRNGVSVDYRVVQRAYRWAKSAGRPVDTLDAARAALEASRG